MLKTRININCREVVQTLKPIWRSFGYDEINWTYTPRGKKIFAEIGGLSGEPYYIRCHNIFTTGNGLSVPTKGSTNVCTAVAGETLKLDFSLLDQVFDTFLNNNCKPIVELGFMPDVLSSGPAPKPTYNYSGTNLWAYPPKDYRKWQDLVFRTVQYYVQRYGAEEIRTWYWELWNEPDNPGFFRGSIKDYCKMYDFAVAGAVQALETIKIGGPGLATNPKFLDKFLRHCAGGKNKASGGRGTRLDFISFHAKGTDWPLTGQPFKMPSIDKIITHLHDYNSIVKKYPEFTRLPCLLDECDMAVATNFGMFDFPELEINNSAYFPVFLIRMAKQIWDFCQQTQMPIQLFTTWAFYFEGKRFFEGNRALFTNENICKPVFNAFKLLEKIGEKRLSMRIENSSSGLQSSPQLDGLAALRSDGAITVLLWNFMETPVEASALDATVEVELLNLSFDSVTFTLQHFRIDEKHCNAFSVWKALGSPQDPSTEQVQKIREVEGLNDRDVTTVEADKSTTSIKLELAAQSVSLLIFRKGVGPPTGECE